MGGIAAEAGPSETPLGGAGETVFTVTFEKGPLDYVLEEDASLGIVVKSVMDGGTTARGGVRRGDILLSCNGEKMPDDFVVAVAFLKAAQWPQALQFCRRATCIHRQEGETKQ